MPTATSFKALGKGNGFPFCLNTIDVLDRGDGNAYDYWVTLGGFKKTDSGLPTQTQINLSLQNAMKLFWNGYKINGTASLDSSYNTASVTDSRNPNTTQLEPFERISLNSGFYDFNIKHDSTNYGHQNQITFYITPVLLKSGNNFLGYGVKNIMSLAEAGGNSGNDYASVQIASTINSSSNTYDRNNYSYITLGGINFVCFASVGYGNFYNRGLADASNLTAYDDYHYAKIDNLNFYTY